MELNITEKRAIVIFIVLLTLFYKQGDCDTDPEAEANCKLQGGVCFILDYCPSAKEDLKRKIRPIICGYEDKVPYVCCFEKEITRADAEESVSVKQCKQYGKESCFVFVYHGTPVQPREYPFMALIGYGAENDVSWLCGGSVVSENYVLSAAHCSESEIHGPATWVRLGEHDLSKTDDAVNVDVRIALRFNHPSYKPPAGYNDIALFRLQKPLTFSGAVRPICLPPVRADEQVKKAWVAGWGRTDFVGPVSKVLLKAEIDVLHHDRCLKHESDRLQLPRGYNRQSMICARREEGGSDTCQGDSGGPLFMEPTQNCQLRTQIGITSFGRDCGNPDFPGIYTKVSDYVKWIESIVWPKNSSHVHIVWKN